MSKKKSRAATRRSRGSKPRAPEKNLVAEIVDQITRKQSAPEPTRRAHRRSADVCSFCLEPRVSGSPYRLVLKCETGDPSTADA
jgi:hypothetical protein